MLHVHADKKGERDALRCLNIPLHISGIHSVFRNAFSSSLAALPRAFAPSSSAAPRLVSSRLVSSDRHRYAIKASPPSLSAITSPLSKSIINPCLNDTVDYLSITKLPVPIGKLSWEKAVLPESDAFSIIHGPCLITAWLPLRIVYLCPASSNVFPQVPVFSAHLHNKNMPTTKRYSQVIVKEACRRDSTFVRPTLAG